MPQQTSQKNSSVAKKDGQTKPAGTAKVRLAVIETGGKQYLVQPGEEIQVEKISRSAGEKQVEFKDLLHQKKVVAEILTDSRTPKISGVKFKKRKGYLKFFSHRQTQTKLKILDIQ